MQHVLLKITILCLFPFFGIAQNATPEVEIHIDSCFGTNNKIADDSLKIWDLVEVQPVFPSGEQALFQFLSQKIKYPEGCDKTEGRLFFSFIIEKNGDVSNLEILKILNECSIPIVKNVFNSMPCWTAGLQNGVPVRVKYTLPIIIRVE
jgi:hypothetical protein